jgi:Cu-Zn family superoxide dismutase
MTRFGLLLIGATALFSAGCSGKPQVTGPAAATVAHSDLTAIGSNRASGKVTLTQMEGYTRIEVTMQGLSPGEHGIHVHEGGDCGNDAKNAGGHFNPEGHPHGRAAMAASHLGDLGNIKAGKDGKGTLALDDPYLSLTGPNSAVGHTFVVHAGPDDFKTQPSGNSGARVACGVILAGAE